MVNKEKRLAILEKLQRNEIDEQEALRQLKESAGIISPDNRHYYAPCWIEQPLNHNKQNISDVIVFMPEHYNFNALLHELKKNTIRVQAVFCADQFKTDGDDIYINPDSSNDYKRLFQIVQEKNFSISHILHFQSDLSFRNDQYTVAKQLNSSIYSLFYITKALMNIKIRNEVNLLYCFFCTSEQHQPVYSANSGFAKTLRLENPKYRCMALSLDEKSGDNLYTILLDELINITEYEVKYINNKRYAAGFKTIHVPGNNPIPFKQGGTYLITGGSGGLGLLFAEHITSKVSANIILSGRSMLSSEKEKRMKTMEQKGSTVIYIQSDISHEQKCRELIGSIIQQFGQLNGVIHSAGLNQDSFLIMKSKEELDKVLQPKVQGTINLDYAIGDIKLDFFVLFSSISGAIGNSGQADYAYANAFLDDYAFYRSSLQKQELRSGKTISINWPLWREGGMRVDKASEEQLKKNMGMEPLSTIAGLDSFNRILNSHEIQAGVIAGSMDKIKERFLFEESHVDSQPQPENNDDAVITRIDTNLTSNQTNSEDFEAETENRLIRLCADLLKVKESDIDKDTELFEYGLNSIMMISLLNKIEKEFDDSVSPNAVADHKTIKALAGFLIEEGVAKNKKIEKAKSNFKKNDGTLSSNTSFKNHEPSKSYWASDKIKIPKQPHEVHHTESKNIWETSHTSLKKSIHTEQPGLSKVAVISMALRLPKSNSPAEFWDNLKNGRDLITETPPDRWDVQKYFAVDKKGSFTSYSKWAGYIDNIDAFDAAFFGISDDSALILDPQHRIILELSQELFDRAGYTKEEMDDSKTAVYLGANEGSYAYRFWDKIPPQYLKNIVVNRIQNMIAARVSDFYNLRGPSLTIDTACSSSLVAVHHACRSILCGESDMAIVGGIDLIIGEYNHIGFSQSGALSREPKSYVFDERAGGFVLGEGAGLILLKNYDKAIADGDNITGVILGTAVNNDGHTMGLTVPDLEGQQDVLKAALAAAQINPLSISYYEAHGTGTLLGDPIEIKAATSVYREYTDKLQYCAVGSVKTNIGHLLRAAGIAGLLKIIVSMENHYIPSTLNCERPHPRFKFDTSPFYPNLTLKPWNPDDNIRRAAISSFGFGGTNAHVILEDFDKQKNHYTIQRKPLPLTKFKRKRYWIGKEITDLD